MAVPHRELCACRIGRYAHQATISGPGVMRRLRLRKGQTAVEYLLVTASLLFVFVMMYKALQYSLANQFRRGGVVIIRMYKEDPW